MKLTKSLLDNSDHVKVEVFRYKAVAIAWLLLISILFIMPGSALPPEGWFHKLHPDKWVHVGFFAVLVFLWRSAFNWPSKFYNVILLLSALLYGLLIEVIQKAWVPNRSFDGYDVLADLAGSLLGLIVWIRTYRKNKPL